MLGLLVCPFALTASASAATITPSTTFDETAAGGTCSLREAVSSANSDSDVGGCIHTGSYGSDTIKLAGGDYDLTLTGSSENANASGDLDATHSLTIVGLGADDTGIDGSAIPDRVLDVPDSGTTLKLSGVDIHGGFAGGIFSRSGTKLVLTDDSVSGNSGAFGGGIDAAGTSANLTRTTVSDNTTSSSSEGGGIYSGANTTLNLTNSTVSGNQAGGNFGQGGGIWAAGTVNLTGTTVSANTATANAGGIDAATANLVRSAVSDNRASGGGGGILADAVNLTDSAVSENTASLAGGGIFANTTATLTGSKVSDNTAGNAGGGIYVENTATATTVTSSTVQRNASRATGGGIDVVAGDLTVSGSTIAGNETTFTDEQGGGIYFASPGTFDLTNSTLTGNQATGWGGGLSADSGTTSTIDLQNATITRNTADADGNGMGDGGGIDQPPFVTVNLKNTIVAGNLDTGGQEPDCNGNVQGGVHSQGYNLFGTSTGCGVTLTTGDQDLAGTDPLVAQLGQNGGSTLTSALLAGSPAINAGNPATPGSGGGACGATDQRGIPRSLAGRCDVGAYELTKCEGALVNVVGTSGADALTGTSGRDGILGLGGNDTLQGLGGNDGLCGGSGSDFLDGGPGTDKCDGGPGIDQATACETLISVP